MINYIPYLDRSLWDSQRLLAYITTQMNTKKKLTQRDICKFAWDEKDIDEFIKKEEDIEISTNDINRLKDLAKQWQ